MSSRSSQIREKAATTGDDSKTKAAQRFVNVLVDLLKFLGELNQYVRDEYCLSSHPVQPFLIMGATATVSSLGDDGKEKVVSVFMSKALDHAEAIAKRDMESFTKTAHSLFADFPSNIVDAIIDIVAGKKIPDESVEDVFTFVDSLFKIGLKFECYSENDSPTLEKALVVMSL